MSWPPKLEFHNVNSLIAYLGRAHEQWSSHLSLAEDGCMIVHNEAFPLLVDPYDRIWQVKMLDMDSVHVWIHPPGREIGNGSWMVADRRAVHKSEWVDLL